MENLLFDDLPNAVTKILKKLNDIETLLYQEHGEKPEPVSQNRWLDIDELTEYLPGNPAKATIYAYVSKKEIPHKKFGKRLAFRQSEIDSWLMSKSQKTIAQIEEEAEEAFTA